jgi:Sodium/hydrogen exchanger family.
MKYENTKNFTLSKESKRFNSLVTFFTGAFFFVYLGGLVSFSNPYSFLIGVAITAALIIARFIGTPVALMKSQYNDDEKFQISYMVSRGMGAGVLATLPLAYGIAGTGSS